MWRREAGGDKRGMAAGAEKEPMATETQSFTVKGMSCGHCARRVENAALGVKGVSSAKVDLGSESLRIECAGEPPVQALAEAIREAGYELVQA